MFYFQVETLKKYEETNSHTAKKKKEETEYEPVFECDNGDGISLDKNMAICGSGKKVKYTNWSLNEP